jgi:hypothetical protein
MNALCMIIAMFEVMSIVTIVKLRDGSSVGCSVL